MISYTQDGKPFKGVTYRSAFFDKVFDTEKVYVDAQAPNADKIAKAYKAKGIEVELIKDTKEVTVEEDGSITEAITEAKPETKPTKNDKPK